MTEREKYLMFLRLFEQVYKELKSIESKLDILNTDDFASVCYYTDEARSWVIEATDHFEKRIAKLNKAEEK